MPGTRDQQVKRLVEGLALGAVTQGCWGVIATKMEVEPAIRRALHDWGFASQFSSLTRDAFLGPNYAWLGFAKSANRQMAFGAWQQEGGWYRPRVLMAGWSAEEALEALARSESHAPAPEAWTLFADRFLSAMESANPDSVRWHEADDAEPLRPF